MAARGGGDGSSDVALRLPGLLVHFDGADICALLARERSGYGSIDEHGAPYLPHRKWRLHDQTLTTDVVCCGRMAPRLSQIEPDESPPYQLLAAGKDPCLVVYAAPWQPSAFHLGTLAAKAGDLQLLQDLRRRGHPWNTEVQQCGAWAGHLHVLRWARENGCPWCWEVCEVAARRGGHTEIVDWVLASHDNDSASEGGG